MITDKMIAEVRAVSEQNAKDQESKKERIERCIRTSAKILIDTMDENNLEKFIDYSFEYDGDEYHLTFNKTKRTK